MGDEKLNSSQKSMQSKELKKGVWARLAHFIEAPLTTLSILMLIISTFLTIIIVTIIFYFLDIRNFSALERERTKRELEQFIEAERSKFKETTAIVTFAQYADTIERYTRKFASGEPSQTAAAIWVLLDILNEVKRNHPGVFNKIIYEYSGVIPFLKMDISPEEFVDSYRGKVWIWVILIESKNAEIMNSIRSEVKKELGLTPELLEKIFKHNERNLPDQIRKDFRESIDRLKPWIKLLRTKA